MMGWDCGPVMPAGLGRSKEQGASEALNVAASSGVHRCLS